MGVRMKNLLLGIDIGTSACKVAVFNKEGTVLASTTADYKVYYPHPGWAEQDADAWWGAVCSAIRELLSQGTAASGYRWNWY
jgi:xylulokinase